MRPNRLATLSVHASPKRAGEWGIGRRAIGAMTTYVVLGLGAAGYIAGAGAGFRGTDDFGIFMAGFAYLLLIAMEASAAKYVEDRARRVPLEVRDMLPRPNEPRP